MILSTDAEHNGKWGKTAIAAQQDSALQSYTAYQDVPLDFVRQKLGFNPDQHQARIFDPSIKRGLLCCTRQFGKSTSVAALVVHHAVTCPKARILVVAPIRNQSGEFIEKVRKFLQELQIPFRGDRSHHNSIRLANGSRILLITARPLSVRSYEATLIVIDEAALVQDAVISAIRPALATRKGTMWMLSTPAGRRGAFYRAWSGTEQWFRLRVTAQECPRIDPDFLAEERIDKGDRLFAQEYEAQFSSPDDAVFDDKLIDEAIISLNDPQQPRVLHQSNWHVIGLDLGRQRDHTAIVVLEGADVTLDRMDYIHWMRQTGTRYTVKHIDRLKLGLSFTEIASRLKAVAANYPGSPIYMDATGLGAPVYDMLKQSGLTNPLRPVIITSADEPSGDHIPKKDLIMNLAMMLEQHDLRLPRDLGNLPLLLEELRAFRAMPTHTGYTRYLAAEGAHDDLIIALALASWPRRPRQSTVGEQPNRLL